MSKLLLHGSEMDTHLFDWKTNKIVPAKCDFQPYTQMLELCFEGSVKTSFLVPYALSVINTYCLQFCKEKPTNDTDEETVKRWLTELDHSNDVIRSGAVSKLAKLSPETLIQSAHYAAEEKAADLAPKDVAELLDTLKNGKCFPDRWMAAKELGDLPDPSEEIFKELEIAQNNPNSKGLRALATISLGKLGREEVFPQLFEFLHYQNELWLENTNEMVRREAARAIHILSQKGPVKMEPVAYKNN